MSRKKPQNSGKAAEKSDGEEKRQNGQGADAPARKQSKAPVKAAATGPDQIEAKLKSPGFFGRSLRFLVMLAFIAGQLAILLAVLAQLRYQRELTAALKDLRATNEQLASQQIQNEAFLTATESLKTAIEAGSKAIVEEIPEVSKLSKLDELLEIKNVLNDTGTNLVKELKQLNIPPETPDEARRDAPTPNPDSTGGGGLNNVEVDKILVQLSAIRKVLPVQPTGHKVAVAISHCSDFDARIFMKPLATAFEAISFRDSHPNHQIGVYYVVETKLKPLARLADFSKTTSFTAGLESPDSTVSNSLDGLSLLAAEFGGEVEGPGRRKHVIVLARDNVAPPEDKEIWNDTRFDAVLFHRWGDRGVQKLWEWQSFCTRHGGVTTLHDYSQQDDKLIWNADKFQEMVSRLWMPDLWKPDGE